MRIVSGFLVVLAISCEALAYWGLQTASGRQAFDEMAGIIPFAAGLAGPVFFAVAAVLWWRARRRRADAGTT
jgi:heme/copper-type cytochrome/quinol oxidase subunit 2